MESVKLYKYLDAEGGLAMLSNCNIQFTNTTKLNDPFDCHPRLIDFSQVPSEETRIWDKQTIMALESNSFEHQRDKTWLCSLSKNYDSLLMWSYQLSTKAKAWEHEQEVRLVIVDPSGRTPHYVPKEFQKKEIIDYKEIRFVPKLGDECYGSVYLGVNIHDEMRNKIINAAKNQNPEIKIYQMKADANAFKLQTEQII